MTRPNPPRLPELGGMTEAGFNRVVAMIRYKEFMPRYPFGMLLGLDIASAEKAWKEWRASLPRTRNKKQRKADAKRAAAVERASEVWFDAFGTSPPDMRDPLTTPAVPCAACGWSYVGTKVGAKIECSCGNGTCVVGDHLVYPDPEPTPIQRLQQFAADTGVPVSFEIAEKAMKGGE